MPPFPVVLGADGKTLLGRKPTCSGRSRFDSATMLQPTMSEGQGGVVLLLNAFSIIPISFSFALHLHALPNWYVASSHSSSFHVGKHVADRRKAVEIEGPRRVPRLVNRVPQRLDASQRHRSVGVHVQSAGTQDGNRDLHVLGDDHRPGRPSHLGQPPSPAASLARFPNTSWISMPTRKPAKPRSTSGESPFSGIGRNAGVGTARNDRRRGRLRSRNLRCRIARRPKDADSHDVVAHLPSLLSASLGTDTGMPLAVLRSSPS